MRAAAAATNARRAAQDARGERDSWRGARWARPRRSGARGGRRPTAPALDHAARRGQGGVLKTTAPCRRRRRREKDDDDLVHRARRVQGQGPVNDKNLVEKVEFVEHQSGARRHADRDGLRRLQGFRRRPVPDQDHPEAGRLPDARADDDRSQGQRAGQHPAARQRPPGRASRCRPTKWPTASGI